MKILAIRGKNLASLAGEFCVDFQQEPLASCGLFAISGPTGAGKSTLLDALCLALYDATPRLARAGGRSTVPDVGVDTVAQQDPRTLLRRGCAEGHAEVDFVGHDGAHYRARWNVRRARGKAIGALQPSTMSLHRLPTLDALGGTKTEVKQEIERRVGLSFEQFTRAVLLAQNEFAAFLKAEENERGELLENLTGSAVYSDISIRAFNRHKREQATLQGLTLRLADQKPLDGAARAQADADADQADARCADLDLRHRALEQWSRWHQQAARLQTQEEQAHATWQSSVAQANAAAPRRDALARIEAAQPARPLVERRARLDAEVAAGDAALSTCAQQLAQADAAHLLGAAGLQAAQERLQQADTARVAAAPRLDLAKALDARLDALAPGRQLASAALADKSQSVQRSQAGVADKDAERARAAQTQRDHHAWLELHQPWQVLAEDWPRWDALFAQASQNGAGLNRLAAALARSRAASAQRRDEHAGMGARLAASAQAAQAREVERQQAIAALAAWDGAQLAQKRQDAQSRRDLLQDADKIWSELFAHQIRAAAQHEQQTQLRRALDEAEASRAQAQAGAPALAAALNQAERALKSAEIACAANVEHLRATLVDDAACPVCGALEHPYRHANDALHALLENLQGEVARCRASAQENDQRLASAGALAAAGAIQLAGLNAEVDALTLALANSADLWECHPLARDAATHDAPVRGTWLRAQLAQAQALLRDIEQREQAARAAGTTRDRAQRACDVAAAAHAADTAAAAQIQTQLAQNEAELAALQGQQADLALQQGDLLKQLDAAFGEQEWQDGWHANPVHFHSERATEAKQWQVRRKASDAAALDLGTLATERAALASALAQAHNEADEARAVLAAQDAAIATLRVERATLWDGQAVRQVEAALDAAIGQASAALTNARDIHQQAGQARARSVEALAQTRRRQDQSMADAAQAVQDLDRWLATWQDGPVNAPDALHDAETLDDQEMLNAASAFTGAGRREDTATPDIHTLATQQLERLRTRLAHDAGWIDAERAALRTLDGAADQAATVLAERRRQRAQHQDEAPPAMLNPADDADGADAADAADAVQAPDAGAIAAALADLAARRHSAQAAAAALHLARAQDDARRRSASALLAEIDAQNTVEQRWGKLNELIGSSDGKKFRNYAQQFTLDVLLGYANSHLGQLARRYRLARIGNPLQPSLGLMVQDLDMGGELRSVHSLSGGESFLLSLALALGLASLSSNRVRVESLFIDEGFGSLDAESLRVAMDALDGLQAMGRKVGVISHVREMTERIATRILVLPAAGGKSAVTVR